MGHGINQEQRIYGNHAQSDDTPDIQAEFTFFLAIPAMFGASFLKLIKFGLNFTGMQVFLLLLGTVVSFAVSILAIKFLMQYIRKHDFKVFGYYRIVLGVIVLLYFGIKTLLA